MAFTIDPTTDLGYVRNAVGDTIASAATWTDDFIAEVLEREGSVGGAIAFLLRLVGGAEQIVQAAALAQAGGTPGTLTVGYGPAAEDEWSA